MKRLAISPGPNRAHPRLFRFWLVAVAVFTFVLCNNFAFTSPAAATEDVGYRAHSYVGTTAPTGEKPQSKLWFNDGSWWGSMFNTSDRDFHIYRYNWAANTWTMTGTQVDDRTNASADCLWDEATNKLYVASAGPDSANSLDSARLYRYSYNPSTDTYTLDPGFPVTVITGGMEAIVLAKDSTGKLWMSYTRSNQVYATHTTTSDSTWITPYVLPLSGAANLIPDDISAIVAYDGKIGIMWSNQSDWAMYFGIHRDGDADTSWTLSPALQLPGYADDHINLKSLQSDPSGRVFAAVKTSLTNQGGPLILLLVLDNQGGWQRHTFGRVEENHTRAIVLIDEENRRVHMFAAAPCCGGGVIYHKESSLDNIAFPQGLGTPFIALSSDPTINNPSSTRQNVNSTTGLLVIAGDDHTRNYVYNRIALPATWPTATPTRTGTRTATRTPTLSPTRTPSRVLSATPTRTRTRTPTLTWTPVSTGTGIPGSTVGPSVTATASATPSATRTATPMPGTCLTSEALVGSISADDPMQVGRLHRDGTRSECGMPGSCPQLADSSLHHYDAYTFTNGTGEAACFNVDLHAGEGCTGNTPIFSAVYLHSFNPADLCTNYLADIGTSPNPSALYSFTVPAGATFVVVVHELEPGAGCLGYSLAASSCLCSSSFADTVPTDYFYEAVRYLACNGVIVGYSDNTFRPYNNTTRGQLAKIVVLAYGLPIYTPTQPTFSDVPTTHTFYQFVETAAYEGLVVGYSDGTFRPHNYVTRGQLSKIVVEAAGWPLTNPPTPTFTDVPVDHTFYSYIETAYEHAIISGYADGTFRPGNSATRGQISKIVRQATAQE
jgi:hypothetical protein